MRRKIACLTMALILVVAPMSGWAQTSNTTTQHLEHLMVENADTPEEHRALARYYRMKAGDARSLAGEHRAMSQRYRGKPGQVQNMRKHCDRIAELSEELAVQYESLAKGEDAAADE